MKKIFTLPFFAALFLAIGIQAPLRAQAPVEYTEYQMPNPYWLSPLFVGSFDESAIYYGAVPHNSHNKPVVVFVHGFIDLANLWFTLGNDMYTEAYESGYRTAFVATTRGEGMWRNGEILAEMLEDITDHYGVANVTIVAHSNGGKASEVAMFEHDKKHLVKRVISLGTPFKGTGVADLAETPAFDWLVDYIGLGGGTSTSTTYYMEGVARPHLDNLPNNQPHKFINFGGWGHDNGGTVAAPLMYVSGELLEELGGSAWEGGNDGVTPFYSSTRPGGNQVWWGWCWGWWCDDTPEMDHIDIALSQEVWHHIRPWIDNNNGRLASPENQDLPSRGTLLESRYELISTMDGSAERFKVGEDAGQVKISLMHGEEGSQFLLVDDAANASALDLRTKRGHNKGVNSFTILDNPAAGAYQIETDAEDFAAMVAYENGVKLFYDNAKISHDEGEAVHLNASLSEDLPATVTAVVVRKHDLNGQPLAGDDVHIVELEAMGDGAYRHGFGGLLPGVYNVTINAEGEAFRRSLVTGFVVRASANASAAAALPTLSLGNYPNPVSDKTTVEFEVVSEGDSYLFLYDAYGRLVAAKSAADLPAGTHTLEWDMTQLPRGNYFLELVSGDQRVTKGLVRM